jgi:hypothetical protein
MEDLKKLKVNNWKEAAKDRRTWREVAEKAKSRKGLYCQMMMVMIFRISQSQQRRSARRPVGGHEYL